MTVFDWKEFYNVGNHLKVIRKRKHTNVQQSADTIIHALAQLKTITKNHLGKHYHQKMRISN